MPKPELLTNSITISVNRTENTIDVTYNDPDQWNNMMTCVLGLGVLYNRCIDAGYPEEKVREALLTSLTGAMATFKTPPTASS